MLKLRRVNRGRLGVRKVVMVRQTHHEGGRVPLRGSTMFRHGSFHIYSEIWGESEGDLVDLDSCFRWNDPSIGSGRAGRTDSSADLLRGQSDRRERD